MGHGSIQATRDTYGHLMPGMDKRVVDALDVALDSARLKPTEGDIGYVG